MRSISKDDRLFAGQILTIDRSRKPCRLRNKSCLLIDISLERLAMRIFFKGVASRSLRYLFNPYNFPHLTNKGCRIDQTHWSCADKGHSKLFFKIIGSHETNLTRGDQIKP